MSYRSTILSQSPDSYWRLGESAGATTAVDEQGAHTGTIGAGTTLGVAGAITGDPNTAFQMNGASDNVLTSGWSLASTNWSFSVLAKQGTPAPTTFHTGAFGLTPGAGAQTQRALCCTRRNATNNRLCYWDNTNSWQESSVTLTLNLWYHLVWVKSGTNLKIYSNGVEVGNFTLTEPADTYTNITIGGSQTTGTDPMKGTLDEPATWSRALSAAEVLAQYTAWITPDITATLTAVSTLTATATTTVLPRFPGDPGDGNYLIGWANGPTTSGHNTTNHNGITYGQSVCQNKVSVRHDYSAASNNRPNPAFVDTAIAANLISSQSFKLGCAGWRDTAPITTFAERKADAEAVLAGTYDSDLDTFITKCLAVDPWPVWCTFFHEPGGDWRDAEGTYNDANSTEMRSLFRQVWRYIVQYFRDHGNPTNVMFQPILEAPYDFRPSSYSPGGGRGIDWRELWPDWNGGNTHTAADFYSGTDRMMDCFGLDVYNPLVGGASFQDYSNIWASLYSEFAADGFDPDWYGGFNILEMGWSDVIATDPDWVAYAVEVLTEQANRNIKTFTYWDINNDVPPRYCLTTTASDVDGDKYEAWQNVVDGAVVWDSDLTTKDASVALVASSTLTATAFRARFATAALSAVSTLTPTATTVGTVAASVPLTAVSTLTAVPTSPTVSGAVALTAVATLSTAAIRYTGTGISFVATSTTESNGTNALNSWFLPGAVTADDLLLINMCNKDFGATPSTVTSGWTRDVTGTNGTTASATDTGSTRATVFHKVAVGGDASPAISVPGGNVSSGRLATFRKSSPYPWEVVATTGPDSDATGTVLTATCTDILDVQAGDMIVYGLALPADTAGLLTGTVLSIPGVVLGTAVGMSGSNTSSANDAQLAWGYVPVISGPATGPPSVTSTAVTGFSSGTLMVTRLRAAPLVTYGLPYDVVIGEVKKTAIADRVIVGGTKKIVINRSVIIGGVKRPLV